MLTLECVEKCYRYVIRWFLARRLLQTQISVFLIFFDHSQKVEYYYNNLGVSALLLFSFCECFFTASLSLNIKSVKSSAYKLSLRTGTMQKTSANGHWFDHKKRSLLIVEMVNAKYRFSLNNGFKWPLSMWSTDMVFQ
jgi:hypothetical protein